MEKKTLERMKKTGTVLLLLFLAAVLAVINVRGLSPEEEAADGLYFQDMSLESFSGGRYTSEEVKKNKLTVFVIWNPYCTACIREMPLLEMLDASYREQSVRFICVDGDAYMYPEDEAKARRAAEENGPSLVHLFADADFTKEIMPLINNAYPYVFLVDSRGLITDSRAGRMNESEWREWIDSRTGA